MTLGELFAAFERDRERHLMGEPSSPEDVDRVEAAIGYRLPVALRAFLERFGGGVFYERHEIFGCQRLMIHDIELVRDLLSVLREMRAREGLPGHLLPFHRAGGIVHLLDLKTGDPARAPVLSWKGSRSYSDFARFLEAVVLARVQEMPSRRPGGSAR